MTLFTEGLPQDQWARATAAVGALGGGDVMLIVGTSSVVYPAASLPAEAKRKGAVLVECNLELPSPLSDIVDVGVAGRAAETLPRLVEGALARRRGAQ